MTNNQVAGRLSTVTFFFLCTSFLVEDILLLTLDKAWDIGSSWDSNLVLKNSVNNVQGFLALRRLIKDGRPVHINI